MRSVLLSNGSVIRFHEIQGSGLPLVFIHGLGCASSCDYVSVITSPALLGRRAILIDLLGFGFSDKPLEFEYTIDAHARVICELLNIVGVKKFDLYGHSMGGAIAIVVAAMLAARVCGLILSEPNLDVGGGVFSSAIASQSESCYESIGHNRNVSESVASGGLVWAGSMLVSSSRAVHRGPLHL